MSAAERIAESAKLYFDYLQENNKGVIVFDVVRVERVLETGSKKRLYRLKLDKKLGSTEYVAIRVLEKQYSQTQVKVLMYDEDNKELYIQVVAKAAKEELLDFEGISPCEVKVIIDLKFLVMRVAEWFKHRDCVVPRKTSGIGAIKTYNDCSAEQEDAVHFSLSRPFSYIWGAPGTGKTRYVLANAVLNCFEQGKRVLIVAPTNNAIEQVLRGLIAQLDALGIDRSNVLRLGMPSKAFSEEYPEVCEVKGIAQVLAETTEKQALLEKVLSYKKERAEFDAYKAGFAEKERSRLPELVRNMLTEMEQSYAEKERIYSSYTDTDIEKIEQEIAELATAFKDSESSLTASKVKKRPIIGCTIDGYIGYCSPSIDTEGAELLADHILLDEAGYTSMAKAATLLSANAPITFFGDHFQLPPVCEADDDYISLEENRSLFLWAQSALYLPELLSDGMDSAYARYYRRQLPDFSYLPKFDLTTTYRFGQNLVDVLCEDVYKTELNSHQSKDNIEIICIDAPFRTLPQKKRENMDEALAIKSYLQKNMLKLGSVAILTPYKNQVSLLRKNSFYSLYDSIFTVHGSQGREFDTVILSVCDTSNKYFTDSNNVRAGGKLIINTAVSRAKRRLVIVCDKTYWQAQKGQLLNKLISDAPVK